MSRQTKDKALGIKVNTVTYDRLSDLCEKIDAPISHFVQGSIDACLEIVEAAPNADIKLPMFLAVTRLRRHWGEINYDGDIEIKRDESIGL